MEGSGIGKAAQDLMQEMQKAQEQSQNLQQQKVGGGQNFQDVMSQQVQDTSQVQGVQQTHNTQQAANVLSQARINQSLPSTKVGAAAEAKDSRVIKMMQGLVSGQDKMQQIMNSALSGRQFNQQELLAMQAGVYRYSQELELTSKVVEKATSGIKQTMNTQV